MRWATSVGLLLAVSISVGGCHRQQSPAPPMERIRITSGIPGAGFFGRSAQLAAAYRRTLLDVDVDLHNSAGTVETLLSIQDGDADVGFALADVTYLAHASGVPERPQAFDRLRGIAVLELTSLHLVTRAGARIRGVPDLRNRLVAIGPIGSGTALSSGIVLGAYGVAPGTVTTELMSWNDAARRLGDRTIDAAFVNAAYPALSVTQATGSGARVVELTGPEVATLRSGYPFFQPALIPAGTYPGQDEPVRTIGVNNLLVCRADLDEDLVYRMTATLFDVLAQTVSEDLSVQIDLEQAPATPIPLHDGAARYYREQELLR